MRCKFWLLALVICTLSITGEEPPILPTNIYEKAEKEWRQVAGQYGTFLRSIGEPSILAHSQKSDDKIYRFTWYRSLYSPHFAVFRLQVDADGKGLLVLRLAKPGKEINTFEVFQDYTKALSVSQVNELTGGFMMSNYLDLLPFIPRNVCDGSAWMLEFSDRGLYHIVFRISPEEKEVQTIGRRFIDQFPEAKLEPIH